MCNETRSLVPGSSEQELQLVKHEFVAHSCSVFDEALGIETQPLDLVNAGSTLSAYRSPLELGKANVSCNSPCSRAAFMLPISAPAHPSQVPSTLSSRKAVPQQQDSKNVVNKLNESSVSQHSPVPRTTLMLSGLYSPIWSHPSTVPKKDGIPPKKGERQLASTAISKNIISVPKHLPLLRAVSLPPKPEPVSSSQAALHIHRKMGLRVLAPPISCGNKPSLSRDRDGEHTETA